LENMILSAVRKTVFLALTPLLTSCGSQQAGGRVSDTVKQGSTSSSTVFTEASFEFGQVLSGAVIEHDFTFRNIGSAPTRIERVSMTTPLLVTQMPREVVPGAEDRIHFQLDTANLEGKFEGTILVNLSDPALPQARLAFSGRIVPAIELSPRPAFFVAGQKGQGNRAAIEIVNHDSLALRIEKIEHRTERFTTKLETLESGQRYRLILDLKPDGPTGRASDTILLKTSSKRMPVLNIAANTYLYNRVHTFPDVVDLGTWRAADCGQAAMTLLVHQEGGSGFRIRLSSDIPGMSFKPELGPKGDQYQVQVNLVPEKVRVGSLKGSIVIDTNDAEFPKVIVPVSGQIVDR
jgi:hypothetical protein